MGTRFKRTVPAHGLNPLCSVHSEMLGHIPLGIELVNKLWRELRAPPVATAWAAHLPSAADTRIWGLRGAVGLA